MDNGGSQCAKGRGDDKPRKGGRRAPPDRGPKMTEGIDAQGRGGRRPRGRPVPMTTEDAHDDRKGIDVHMPTRRGRCPDDRGGIPPLRASMPTDRRGVTIPTHDDRGGRASGRPRPKGIDAHVTTKGPRHDRKGGHRCAHDDRGGRAWAGPDRMASMPTHVTTRRGPTAEDAHSGCPQQGIDAHTTRCPGGGPPCGGMDAEGRVQGDGNPKGPLTTPRQGGGPR